MKTPLVLLALSMLFIHLHTVLASPTRGPRTGWTAWDGWPVLVFLLCFGIMIFLMYVALRFSKKK